MYYQTTRGDFVLNPCIDYPDFSYYTDGDGIIHLLCANKKQSKRIADTFFESCTLVYEKKVGSYNSFEVTLTGPIKEHDVGCVLTGDPPINEAVIFFLFVDREELTNKNSRSTLLRDWVLKGAHPTQFNKLLKENFTVESLSLDDPLKIVKSKTNETNSETDT